MTVGQYLRSLRGGKSLSQMAKEVGASKGHLYRIENDECSPKIETLFKLLKPYNADINTLFILGINKQLKSSIFQPVLCEDCAKYNTKKCPVAQQSGEYMETDSLIVNWQTMFNKDDYCSYGEGFSG